jgi:ribonucleoside-diphosphate reductase alpha chain
MSLLADIAILRTYSALKSNGKKETWQEVVDRYRQCLVDNTPRFMHDDIYEACKLVQAKVVLPSMRFLQFAGEGIKRENVRGYNCSFTPVDNVRAFSEIFYILMCGTGVGYSVQRHHIGQLPQIQAGSAEELYVVQDSKEGWADSIAKLIQNPDVRFDYSQVRPAGALLSTGGTASGPESLVRAHGNVRRILQAATGRKLRSIEVHDVVCHIADVVVVGGVRRAALISLFDRDDSEMLTCKSGQWWEQNPQRARANNSAVLPHGQVDYDEFSDILDRTYNSFSGEPGIFWTSDPENNMGTNPCCEIALNPRQFCNLTTINFAKVQGVHEFLKAVSAATRLGTIQASFTNFGYLSEGWAKQTREEALLGVSLTGLAANAIRMQQFLSGNIFQYGATLAKDINYYVAQDLSINPAARVTTVKPEGTTSTCLDTTSGIHAAHAPYYLRRIRIDKGQELGQYLQAELPAAFVEDDKFNPQNLVVSVPFAMPNAVTRADETASAFLQNVFAVRKQWIEPGHREGWNFHNVSCTVSYKEEERDLVKRLMWVNRKSYNGISLLPYDGGTYVQAPFEEISKEEYERLAAEIPQVDLYDVTYGKQTKDERVQVLACVGDSCTLT